MMRNLSALLALSTLSFTLLSTDAHAAEWESCWTGADMRWSGTSLTLRAHTGGFPTGGYWKNGLQSAVSAWAKSPSKFRYYLSTDSSVGLGNGQSEVWWSGSIDSDALGVCYRYGNIFCNYTEADVVFNTDYDFSTSTSKSNVWAYSGALYDEDLDKPYSFIATAIHELGHAQGLDHEGGTYNVMGIADTHYHANGSTARCYAGEDSVDGSMDVYGKFSQPLEDLAITHWRRSGSYSVSGQLPYSTHSRCRIFRNGSELSGGLWNDREPFYLVNKGWDVDFELSYENLGKTTKTVTVKYYVSTNDYISNYDTYIGSRTMTLGVNTVYTSKTEVTIPTSLTSGKTYWLGAIIDAADQVDEIDHWNNATYTAIKIN